MRYLTIVQATRRMYAALQHRPSAEREPLYLACEDLSGRSIYRATVHVATVRGLHRRRAEITRFINLLTALYPEAHSVSATFDRYRA